jgi:hypothetical protein
VKLLFNEKIDVDQRLFIKVDTVVLQSMLHVTWIAAYFISE